jgi:DNA polymerase
MRNIFADFETFGRDLPDIGAEKYSLALDSGIYTLHWFFEDQGTDIVHTWIAQEQPFPSELREALEQGAYLYFRNARFDRHIYQNIAVSDHDAPWVETERFRCTQAWVQTHGIRGGLDDSARTLGIGQAKHAEGTRLIHTYSALCVPWADIPPEDKALFIKYGEQDVRMDYATTRLLRPLTAEEWHEFQVNERTNNRGVPIDVPFVNAALNYAGEIQQDVDKGVRAVTGGAVETARARKTRDAWILPRLTEFQREQITNKKGNLSFDEDHRAQLLACEDVDPDVVAYIDLVNAAGGATLAKYRGMAMRNIDGRVPGVLRFSGAGQTGRFSSTGIQLHNLRRDSLDDPDPVIRQVLNQEPLETPATTLSQLIRSAIYSPQKGLCWYDYSGIESRVAPWLAGSPAGERKLNLFRRGIDPYKINAEATFGIPYDQVEKGSPERQAGKVQELALQFLGGVGALQIMARGYGMDLDEELAIRMVAAWRNANPWARDFGEDLNMAAWRAYFNPGQPQKAGRIIYQYDGKMWLWCRLPSGRLLAYLHPRVETIK